MCGGPPDDHVRRPFAGHHLLNLVAERGQVEAGEQGLAAAQQDRGDGEMKLVEHPKVLEAAVVGQKDGDELIKPAAYIVLNNAGDAGEALKEELLAHCKNGLARYKYPRWINFVPDLPKTATGKIQRFRLRQS